MYTYLEVSELDRTVYINIKRADRLNGLGLTMGKELHHYLSDFKNRTDVYLTRQDLPSTPRCLILTATRTNSSWIPGGDLKELSELNGIEVHDYISVWSEICALLRKINVPTIAIIDGGCLGGGAELALSCDLRIMTEDSYFSFKQVQIGLSLGYGTTDLITRILGEARARSILLLGKTISAKEALALGLLETIATQDSLEADKRALITHILNLSPYGIAAQKKNFEISESESESLTFLANWGNSDHRKFLNAFTSKS
jgi:enoyl-CoA hydratase